MGHDLNYPRFPESGMPMLAGSCPPIDWSIAFCHSYRWAPYARERSTNDKALAILLRYMVTVLNTPDIYASSEARRGEITRVSGQRPEQGADATFLAQQKTWAQGPYPAQ